MQNGNHDESEKATTSATTNTRNDGWGFKMQLRLKPQVFYPFFFLVYWWLFSNRLDYGMCIMTTRETTKKT